MEQIYNLVKNYLGDDYLKAYDEIETVQALKHLKYEQLVNIKTLNFHNFNFKYAYKTFVDRNYRMIVKNISILSTYLLYSTKLDDELPKKYYFDEWQKYELQDFAIEQDRSYKLMCYPFECYIIRQKKLPSQNWIDKEFVYQINPITCQFVCQNFSIEQIEKLRQMMNAESFKKFILRVCQQKCNEKYEKVITKYIDIAKEFVVDFFYVNDFVLDVFKQDGWLTRKIQEKPYVTMPNTIFLYAINFVCCEYQKELVNTLQQYYYNGCLQTRIYHYGMLMTPAYIYLYEFEEIPPEWLQYPNWEKEKIIDMFGKDINFIQHWITEKHKEIPEEILKLLNVDQKFTYQELLYEFTDSDLKEDSDYTTSGDSYDDYSDDDYVVQLNGTIDDAYKYYDIGNYCDENVKEFYKKYKINNGQCILCKQKNKEIYSFCDNHHVKGICLSCFATLKICKCPVCNKDIIKFNKNCMLCKFI